MFIIKIFIFTFCIYSFTAAQENKAVEEELYIDYLYRATATNVKFFSEYIDQKFIDIADLFHENNQTSIKEAKENTSLSKNRYSDKFFLNDKYMSEINEPFLRISPETIINSKSKFYDDRRLKINLNLPLSRSKKRFHLFLKNLIDNEDKYFPEIGISYLSPVYYKIKSKYSIGIHQINPFTSARYSSEFSLAYWDSELIQIFKYYADNRFEEKTQIYFDTSFLNLSLFRLLVERGTNNETSGMFYNMEAIIFWQPCYKSGITLTNKVFASTQYTYTKNTQPDRVNTLSGIHNYLTSIKYRQNFFRKWLFYEVETGVNFSVINDYKVNHSLRFSLDIFYADI